MNYQSTRDPSVVVSSAKAIAQGISKEGGLFVPQSLPNYTSNDICELQETDYVGRAVKILSDFLPDYTQQEIESSVTNAYAPEKFSGAYPAPLSFLKVQDSSTAMLELWHGPTCAFKDMALQLLPHLLTKALQKTSPDKTAVILVATSGDTGKAALEGFKDVNGTRILVFYPEDGVSPMQKRQMNTQEGENVSVCAIKGNFDDAQTGVKKIFTDSGMNAFLEKSNMLFSSANSINWGRLVPQIVYYFSAYCDMVTAGKIKNVGDPVNFVVPTGNFGNILAAYYAKQMGLPLQKLICASNSNNVLTDFLKTGHYNRKRQFFTTLSPSMDILVSSNLERLLFHLTDGDTGKVDGWMKELSSVGEYQVGAADLQEIQKIFFSGFCDDKQTEETIKTVFDTEHYLCDSHTAVAVNVYGQYVKETGDKTPSVIVSTASPYKFAASVLNAVTGKTGAGDEFEQIAELSEKTDTEIPEPIKELSSKPVRFNQVCDADTMKDAVLTMLK